jgi:hypothetical protein
MGAAFSAPMFFIRLLHADGQGVDLSTSQDSNAKSRSSQLETRIMHQPLRSASKMNVGIEFLLEKSLMHSRIPNSIQFSQ